MNQKEYTGRSILANTLGVEPVDPRSATIEECRKRCDEVREKFGMRRREPKPDDDFLGLALDLNLSFFAWMESEGKRLDRKVTAMQAAGGCTPDEAAEIHQRLRRPIQ